ncbi:hypothetical protein CQ052_19560 [Ochrobactrum sp. MYb15]|uniref:hypothetical protein n=1 Tax=Brucella pituitosa TaxID=571256 RepID=UPI000CFE24AC|nr:hypothetical protein CQZ90_21640 [Ochrobactrum sp. MYb19]PRA60570.1 hypothetical protein CQ053_21415 [Ochrobactrum sp. MYb18]PRA73549.1 hypothetical protein CQ049_21065 [Brucella thiophenivorans]PRA84712.1 hypothetical protein CQ051_21655 [Ochrobactrum sp. MYb14]PRA94605.1 hypothetical protein CQ052_19560 [Ochrobactrum sp. MYb15]
MWNPLSNGGVSDRPHRKSRAAQGMDISGYSERARDLAQGFRSGDRADLREQQEAEKQRQKQIE